MKKKLFLILAVLSLGITFTPQASASSGFNAGRIVDDSVFTNKSSMSVDAIQSFLNSKVTACDTSGSQQSEMNNNGVPDYNSNGSIQRWEWGKYKYNQTTFPCLRDYKQNNVSSAQLIYNASQNYSINPQVLIVLLQKEQGLITDTWPLDIQYRSATGYGCPDTAACNSQYYGLANQINWAAKMFRAILDNSPNWYTPYVLGDNYIQYNPNSSCGGSTVTIQNRSTQALYNYTPYQPNQAALDAGWGTANCGAYGNRNFYLYFTNWFGSVYGYKDLDSQRWMTLPVSTYKKDPANGSNMGSQLPAGTQLYFVDKTFVNGQWYLRTEYDKSNNINRGILQNSLSEIPFETFSEPRYLEITADTNKINPLTRWVDATQVFPTKTRMLFKGKVLINDIWFYRTAYDQDKNRTLSVPADKTREVTFDVFETPRYMRAKNNTQKIDPIRVQSTNVQDADEVIQNSILHFNNKVTINGRWFYRVSSDTANRSPFAIPSEDIEEIPYSAYSPAPSWLELKNSSSKIHPVSGEVIEEETLESGTHIKIVDQIVVNGISYLRTEFDKANSLDKGILESDFKQIQYTAMEQPRKLKLSSSLKKLNPVTGIETGDTFPQGMEILFATKIVINGEVFLRTQYDSATNNTLAIPLNLLAEVNQ